MQKLKAEESELQDGAEMTRKAKRPRAIIMAPTRELATQILSVVKHLSHSCKLSSVGIIGGDDMGKQRRALDKQLDIVVGTPGRLLKHREDGNFYLGSVSSIVIDETDTMLEQGFQADIAKLVHPCLYEKGKEASRALRDTAPQVVLTTATMTPAVRRLLENEQSKKKSYARRFESKDSEDAGATIKLPPDMKLLEAAGLHRAVPRLRQVFIDVGSSDKLTLLSDIVHGGGGGGGRKGNSKDDALTMVFCNTVQSSRAAEHALAESGIESLGYHGELNSALRAQNLKAFRERDGCNVLVCTDMAARGLDIPNVDHVVMFDFPLNSIDYLHRAGRTARGVNDVGAKGSVTALVAKRDKVLATAIERAVIRGDPLDSLSSRKSDYRPGGKLSRQLGGRKDRAVASRDAARDKRRSGSGGGKKVGGKQHRRSTGRRSSTR